MKRKELIEQITTAGRRMSTVSVIFHQVVAEKIGLSGADHKYLDFLMQEGSMTAGQLAEKTGLTSGAITGLIDRLEKNSFVRREKDPHDRRKVLVVPQVEEGKKKLGPIFGSFQHEISELYEQYPDPELEVILDFLLNITQFLLDKTEQVKLIEIND